MRPPDDGPPPIRRPPSWLSTATPIRGEVRFSLPTSLGAATVSGLGALWRARDRLDLLRRGVCDHCALGASGLRDAVTPGLHLCDRRLAALTAHLAGPLAPHDLGDLGRLRASDADRLRGLGRLPVPYAARPGGRGFERVSWEDALALAGTALREVPGREHRWRFSASGLSLEARFAAQKAARLLGSSHLGDRASAGLRPVLGRDAATAALSDLIAAELVLVWDVAALDAHPQLQTWLRRARASGARIVGFDAGADATWADDVLPADAGLADALCRALRDASGLDDGFLAAHTVGADALFARLDAEDTPCALPYAQREWLLRLLIGARRIVSVWTAGAADGAAIARLHLLRGALGRVGAGLLPLGPAGSPEVGVHPDELPGRVPLDADSAAALGAAWGRPIPDWRGLGEPPLAAPATMVAQIGDRLRVHLGPFVTPDALSEPAAWTLLLPGRAPAEQSGTYAAADRTLRLSPDLTGWAPSFGRPTHALPGQLAAAADPTLGPLLTWADPWDVRREIARYVPDYAGIDALRHAGDRLQWGGERLAVDRAVLA